MEKLFKLNAERKAGRKLGYTDERMRRHIGLSVMCWCVKAQTLKYQFFTHGAVFTAVCSSKLQSTPIDYACLHTRLHTNTCRHQLHHLPQPHTHTHRHKLMHICSIYHHSHVFNQKKTKKLNPRLKAFGMIWLAMISENGLIMLTRLSWGPVCFQCWKFARWLKLALSTGTRALAG